jgi:magnesium chelatase family protein
MGTNPLPGKPLRGEVLSISLSGLVASLVSIVVTIEHGTSAFDLLHLAESSVRETKSRVLSALAKMGHLLDGYNIKVAFYPGGLRNEGLFDLAIATAVLLALEQKSLPRTVILGELAPTGAILPVRGVLPALLGVQDMSRAIVPWANGPEVSCIENMEVQVAMHLRDVHDALRGVGQLQVARDFLQAPRLHEVDLADIRGLLAGRRALEISAAGLHPLLLVSSPGSANKMLSQRLPTVMPPLTHEEEFEVTSIYSVAGLIHTSTGLITNRPWRGPNCTMIEAGLIGGSSRAIPGEVSLAHLGVLFLDELPEFKKKTRAALDRVLEEGHSVICQDQNGVTFPARPLTVASALPCPCGFHGVKGRKCTCSPERLRSYQDGLRGPVFDRMDMMVFVSEDALSGPRGECSVEMRVRVIEAREVQQNRFDRQEVTAPVNSRLSPADLDRVAKPDDKGQRMLRQAIERLGLSTAHYIKMLRVSRTIADLDGSDAIRTHHIAEAIEVAPAINKE